MAKTLHLFLFYDSLEEVAVIAYDKEDCWKQLEHVWGDRADDFLLSNFLEYSDAYEFATGRSAGDIAEKTGRAVIEAKPVGTYGKPYPAWDCEPITPDLHIDESGNVPFREVMKMMFPV